MLKTLTLHKKATTTKKQLKCSKDLNRDFIKGESQMGQKHMKRC